MNGNEGKHEEPDLEMGLNVVESRLSSLNINPTSVMSEKMRRFLAEQSARDRRDSFFEDYNPLAIANWIRVEALLRREALNGKLGEIIQSEQNGRFLVRISAVGEKQVKLIKKKNVVTLPKEDMVCCVRLCANGERSGPFVFGVRNVPLSVLRENACRSPVSNLVNAPLNVTRADWLVKKPRHTSPDDFDNQWATYFMIDPESGFAPPEWQAFVGPVYIWWNDLSVINKFDVCIFYDYISSLLEQFGDGIQPVITPEGFRMAKLQFSKQYPEVNLTQTYAPLSGALLE